jgi:hypothetical protein
MSRGVALDRLQRLNLATGGLDAALEIGERAALIRRRAGDQDPQDKTCRSHLALFSGLPLTEKSNGSTWKNTGKVCQLVTCKSLMIQASGTHSR